MSDRLLLELAQRLRDAELDGTADKLGRAWTRETKVLALEVADREAILRVLEQCPDGLAELRAVLLAEHVGRKRDGLA